MSLSPWPAWLPRDNTLARWIVASLIVHVMLVKILPAWQARTETPPLPLQVELRETPPLPEVIPPKPLPVAPAPAVKEKPAPIKPEPLKAPREARAPEPPREVTSSAPIPPAPPEAPPAPQAPVVAEPKPAPPPPLPPEAPRAAALPLAPATAPIFDAAYLNNPKPPYPMVAMRRGESGTVYVLVLVTKEGKPARVNVQKSSGSLSLDEAAVRAINGWRFVPARKGSEPVEGEVVVPMAFDIKDARQ